MAILGIDEVGRGVWAGPLVVGAVVLGDSIEGLTDSKKLSKKNRETLAEEIQRTAECGLGWVSANEIDTIGLSQALRLATRRAVEQIKTPYHEIIIDGTINFLSDTKKGAFVTTLKKADLLIPSVSAASIIAKVARDRYMAAQDEAFPGYDFASHVGYGTKKHRDLIAAHGVCSLHRLSVKPLQQYARAASRATTSPPSISTTKITGDRAEAVVAALLVSRGHEVLARNWRTKICEIDIVTRSGDTLYFTEVKYRVNGQYGDGMAAINFEKVTRMRRAAELFLQKHRLLDNTNAQLLAAAVSGEDFVVQELIALE